MPKDIGPRSRIDRRFGEVIVGKSKVLKRKKFPPGQHGKKHVKKSDYRVLLEAKQKIRLIYRKREHNLHNLYKKAKKKREITGVCLLQMLECEFSNFVSRLLGITRAQARQWVTHRHFLVNGKMCNVPSRRLLVNDKVRFTAKANEMGDIGGRFTTLSPLPWISWSVEQREAVLLSVPRREEIPEKVKEQSLVEFYSK